MQEQRYNGWHIRTGATFQETITYLDPDGVTPVDLTGYGAAFIAKPSYTHATKIIDLDESDGITIDAVNGKITIYLSPSDTQSISDTYNEDKLVYNLHLTQGDDIFPLLFGELPISREMT